MTFVTPAWLVVVGKAQEDYKDDEISYVEAVKILDENHAPAGCYTVLNKIRDSKWKK